MKRCPNNINLRKKALFVDQIDLLLDFYVTSYFPNLPQSHNAHDFEFDTKMSSTIVLHLSKPQKHSTTVILPDLSVIDKARRTSIEIDLVGEIPHKNGKTFFPHQNVYINYQCH